MGGIEGFWWVFGVSRGNLEGVRDGFKGFKNLAFHFIQKPYVFLLFITLLQGTAAQQIGECSRSDKGA